MTPLERMLIEHECTRLQTRYTLCADRLDVDGFVELFLPDASIQVPEYPPFVGHAAIRQSMQGLAALAQNIPMRHLCTNSAIDVIDADNATGSCYLVVFNSAGAADERGCRPVELPGTVGEYHDEFRRTSAGWRFRSRVLQRVFRRSDDPVRKAAEAQSKRSDS